MPIKSELLADLAKRNAGRPTLTVHRDGSFVIHGERDAEIDARCTWPDGEGVVLSLDLETLNPIAFPDLQARIDLYETTLPWRNRQ